MTRIIVLSDTHDNLENIKKVIKHIKEIDPVFVIHAGDIISPFALKMFNETGKKTYFVFGNNDGEKILSAKIAEQYGFIISEQPLFIDYEKYKIVVIHGINGSDKTKRFVNVLAKSGEFDLVVYGHLHEVEVTRVNNTLIVNPGELSGYLTGKATFAIVDLDEKSVEIKEL